MSFYDQRKVDLRDYLRIVLRRVWLVIIPIVVAVSAAFVATMPRFKKPVYRASARLELEFPQPLSRELQGIVSQPGAREQFARLTNLTQSTSFLEDVIRQTRLAEDPGAREWAREQRTKYPSLSEEDLVELYLIRYLRDAISTGSGRRDDNSFTVTVLDYYPRRALELCNAITDGVVSASKSQLLEQMKATQDFATEQVANYKRQLEEAEAALHEYQSGAYLDAIEAGLVNARNHSLADRLLRNAGVQVDEARGKRDRLASEVIDLGEDAERWLRLARPSDLEAAVRELADLVTSLTRSELRDLGSDDIDGTTTSLSVQLANKNRDVRAAFQRRLAGEGLAPDAERLVLDLIMADLDLENAQQRRSFIDREIQDYRQRAAQIPLLEAKARQKQQEVDTIRAMFDTFVRQVYTTTVSVAFEMQKSGGNLQVAEPAQLPLDPVNSNRLIMLIVAGVGGLCMGILLVFLVEHHDTTVRDVSELPEPLREHIIGSMPLIKDRLRKEREYKKAGLKERVVPVFDYYRDEAASSFEFRRLVLELAGSEGVVPKTIMVTSSERGEGKTTTTSLLALTLARHRRLRTVVVDLDFRRPTLHRQLALAQHQPGCAEALSERSLPSEWILATAEGNLHLLPAGSFKRISAETLTPESVGWLVDELKARFDVVLLDTPPNLAVPDPLVVGKVTDAVIFVVKAGATSQRVVTRGFDLQRRANDNVVGVFLNNIRNIMPYYYSYDYYGYTAEDDTPQVTGDGPKAVPTGTNAT